MCGALLDGFRGQVYEDRGVWITDPVHHAGRYLDFLAGKPVSGFDDQLTNCPALGVHHKVTDVADSPISCLEMITVHGLSTPQMSIGALGSAAAG